MRDRIIVVNKILCYYDKLNDTPSLTLPLFFEKGQGIRGGDAQLQHLGMTRGGNEKGREIIGGDSQQKLLGMTI